MDRKRSRTIMFVAGLYGNQINVVTYRRGSCVAGQAAVAIRCPAVDEPPDQAAEESTRESQNGAIKAQLAQYESSGRFTDIELRTLRAIWLDREPIRTIARREGVSRQAVIARIEGTRRPDGRLWGGLLKKAPEFASDWPQIKRLERWWWAG